MAKPLVADVFSHWHKAVDPFQTSVLEFYSAVEAAVERRQIPDISSQQITLREGGALSANRVYHRFSRRRLTFDVCAAPFGTGFLFTWWLTLKRPSRWLLLLLVAQIAVAFWVGPRLGHQLLVPAQMQGNVLAVTLEPVVRVLFAVGAFCAFFLVTYLLSFLWKGEADDHLVAVPVLGDLYVQYWKPLTYFRVDTTLMYQAQVKAAVEEVVDGVLTAKGLRALTEDEKKPIMREFLKR